MNPWTAFFSLFRREVSRFFKVPLQTLGTPIINTLLYLLIFGVSLGESIDLEGKVPYLAFLIPGLVAMAAIKNSFDNSSSAIIGQKYHNELQDLRVTPLSLHQLYFAKNGASLLRGALVALITCFVGECFHWICEGSFLPLAHPFIFLYFVLIGSAGFASLGCAVGMWSNSFEKVGAFSSLLLLPLIYLGGVFFSLERVHPIWQLLSHFNPLFYMINGARFGMIGESDSSLPLAMGVTLLFLLISYCLALLSFRKGSRYFR